MASVKKYLFVKCEEETYTNELLKIPSRSNLSKNCKELIDCDS